MHLSFETDFFKQETFGLQFEPELRKLLWVIVLANVCLMRDSETEADVIPNRSIIPSVDSVNEAPVPAAPSLGSAAPSLGSAAPSLGSGTSSEESSIGSILTLTLTL